MGLEIFLALISILAIALTWYLAERWGWTMQSLSLDLWTYHLVEFVLVLVFVAIVYVMYLIFG